MIRDTGYFPFGGELNCTGTTTNSIVTDEPNYDDKLALTNIEAEFPGKLL